MGIISRFKDIMSANINALLDKAENPEKMIDQYLRNLQDDLGKVKAETASVMAEETRCKRALDECNAEIAKFQNYAVKAVEAGNDDDARQFLTKKNQLLEKQTSLQQAYTLAADNAAKMKQMHDKLVGDINELNTKKEAIKAKMAVAKTQERINKIGSSVAGAENNMSAFGRMEAKVDKMLDEANAMAELNDLSANDPTAALAEKYEDKQEATAVDDELAALKASLGK
ncbi:MAG: PspA/IM30 family protein [Lachnospiraceae bacterium]